MGAQEKAQRDKSQPWNATETFPAAMQWQAIQEARQGRMPLKQVYEENGIRPNPC